MNTKVNVRTNNQPRELLTFNDLTAKEAEDFRSYVKEDDRNSPSFFRYRKDVFYLGNFMRTQALAPKWDGAEHYTMSSGVCVRYTPDLDHIVVGTFWS
jgi:hypothetical protein